MSDAADPNRDEDFLSAEYALGVLTGRERRRAERLMREDDGFAADVAAWEERLEPLHSAIRPVAPPPHVWNAVERELPRPRPAAPASGGLRRRVSALWQWLAIGSAGVAAASLAALAIVANEPAPQSGMRFAASIAAENGTPLFAAVIDPASGQATLVPLRADMPADRVPELWFIPEGGTPISLGVLDRGEPLRVDLQRRGMEGHPMTATGTLAISAEPRGGSPTGQPTGPVVGQGSLRSI